MSQRIGWIAVLALCTLAGCGGGGSSSGSASSSSTSSSSGASSISGASSSSSGATVSNIVPVTVGPGPAAAKGGTFNIPYASVTLCQPGTTTCATIDNVLVDTGSFGLRIMASALQAAGLSLTATVDPANAANSIAECLPFADGYTWGPVTAADVSIGGELAGNLSVNIIDDNMSYAATVPSGCKNLGSSTSLNSVTAFDANGVLGVGTFDQDCGASCAGCASLGGSCSSSNDLYYSCNTGANTCTFTPVALAAQVRNPVAAFATDNNGVILQLPPVPATGQTRASGSLIFGIATQSNNALGSATVITAGSTGDFTTTFNGQTLGRSFIDSGSNGLYFPDSSIIVCSNTPANPTASDFYCPPSPVSLMATNQGQNGTMSPVSFEITSVTSLSNTFYASRTIGGPAATNTMLGSYFDWGLPFFYGRSVYTAIEGKTAGSATGPYYAY
jgi:hypothetical protein